MLPGRFYMAALQAVNMRITICGSSAFKEGMVDCKEKLERLVIRLSCTLIMRS